LRGTFNVCKRATIRIRYAVGQKPSMIASNTVSKTKEESQQAARTTTTYGAMAGEGHSHDEKKQGATSGRRPAHNPVSISNKKMLKVLWKRRLEYLLDQVRHNTSIFMSDVGVLYSRYVPMQLFLDSEFDMSHALAPEFPQWVKEEQGFVVNAGITFYRGNAKVEQLLKTGVQKLRRPNS